MTITPEQARKWRDDARPGPWYVHTAPGDPDGTFIYDDLGNMCIAVEPTGSAYLAADLDLIAAAPDLAQTVIDQAKRIEELEAQLAGMTEEWGVERDRPWSAYIDGTVAREITWIGDEARARKACVTSPRGGNPRLVSRLVGPTEATE